jgi:hypothetical protein
MIKVKLHKTQYDVASDEHKYRVIDAGRQWGKSVLARLSIIQWAAKTPGTYWIVSPTYVQGKQNHWRQLQKEIPVEWIEKKNEIELSIQLKNGSIILLKSADNPDALRGATINGLVVDEVASIKNWYWLWQEALSGTLIRHDPPVIFISTPKGFNEFYELFMNGQKDDSIWKSWKFTSYDNPHIAKEVIDRKKEELTEDAFAQEYLADFRRHTGLIYKDFDPEYHVIEPFEIPDSWDVYCGVDFGDVHPFACIWIATDGEYNFWVIDEIYGSNLRLDEVAGMYNSNKYRNRVVTAWCDPSRPDWIKELEWRKMYLTAADKSVNQEQRSWVTFGIEKVAEKIKPTLGKKILTAPPNLFSDEHKWNKGLPALFVFNNCVNIIKEFGLYKWKVNREGSEMQPVPDKINDDALDSLRYMLVSYKKSVAYVEKASDISNANWSLDMNKSGVEEIEQDWSISG